MLHSPWKDILNTIEAKQKHGATVGLIEQIYIFFYCRVKQQHCESKAVRVFCQTESMAQGCSSSQTPFAFHFEKCQKCVLHL